MVSSYPQLGLGGGQVAVVRAVVALQREAAGHGGARPRPRHAQRGDARRARGQRGQRRGEGGRHRRGRGGGAQLVADGRPGPRPRPRPVPEQVVRHQAAAGRVHVSRRPARDDGRHAGGLLRPRPALVLEGGDLVEDVRQGLVLRAPVQQVVPVVAASQLLLGVDDAEKCAKLLKIL